MKILTNGKIVSEGKILEGYDIIIEDNKIAETITALQVLGYTKYDIDKTLEQIDTTEMELEDIIKQALKILSTK